MHIHREALPLQRRLPKRGFKSQSLKYNAEVTLSALGRLDATEVDMLVLKNAGLVGELTRVVKVIKSGELTAAFKLTGIGATAGAKAAIEADRVFTMLMGDEVEPRKLFIQAHASQVRNLDV